MVQVADLQLVVAGFLFHYVLGAVFWNGKDFLGLVTDFPALYGPCQTLNLGFLDFLVNIECKMVVGGNFMKFTSYLNKQRLRNKQSKVNKKPKCRSGPAWFGGLSWRQCIGNL